LREYHAGVVKRMSVLVCCLGEGRRGRMWWVESDEDILVNVTRDVLQSVHVVG